MAFLSSSHFIFQGLRRDAIMHLFWLQTTNKSLGKASLVWRNRISLKSNPWFWDGQSCAIWSWFPWYWWWGSEGNCSVDHDILGALVTQNSLMSVLLNAHGTTASCLRALGCSWRAGTSLQFSGLFWIHWNTGLQSHSFVRLWQWFRWKVE